MVQQGRNSVVQQGRNSVVQWCNRGATAWCNKAATGLYIPLLRSTTGPLSLAMKILYAVWIDPIDTFFTPEQKFRFGHNGQLSPGTQIFRCFQYFRVKGLCSIKPVQK